MKFFLTVFITIFCSLAGFAQFHYVKQENRLQIATQKGTLLLEPYSDSIIRVRFVPGERMANKKEISVVRAPANAQWQVDEEKGLLQLKTGAVIARVSVDGHVRFFDKTGQLLLAELPDGRKLSSTTDQGVPTYTVRQAFGAADEALYGLGQYQNGLMDWKNTPLQFKQFNQQDAVPFLVSTKGYGILWNNYSVTDFNPCDSEIHFSEVVDKGQNVRKGRFTPTKTGTYCFAVESESPKANRFKGPVKLLIGGRQVIYYNTIWVPEFLSGKIFLQAGKTVEVLFQNANAQVAGKVLYNEPDYNRTVFESRIGEGVDYFFVYGQDPAGVVRGYRWLTGAAPLFGKWAYGFWQCRERYSTQEQLLENAADYRRKGIPVDNIVQDWNYWPDSTWGPEWNRKKYPDPLAMTRTLGNMHIHLMVSVWPRVDNRKLEAAYDLADHKIDSKSGNLDLWDPKVQHQYYRMISDSMFRMGVSSIWLDGTEPENYEANAHTSAGSFDKVALTYPMKVTEALYEGHRKEFPDLRVFNLTRSAFAGMQRYGAAYWTGDIAGTWQQLKEQIPGGLNFSMAGLPYWTTDIGGFFRDHLSLNSLYDNQYTNPEYKELLTRWFEFGAFCPIFRIHGYKSNTEVWRYGKTFETIARTYIDLRYQLLPYIYTTAADVTKRGDIMMRPLVYDYPGDKNTWHIKDEYLFGPYILVSPVTDYRKRSRSLYLPAGHWYNFWTGEKLTGGRSLTVPAPLNRMPLFVKAGAILPVGPKVQYAMQPTTAPLRLFIYGGADGSYNLYEDEGETYCYENGAFSIIPLTWNDRKKVLTIGSRIGFYKGLKKNRIIKIVFAGTGSVSGLLNETTDVVVDYNGAPMSVYLGNASIKSIEGHVGRTRQ